MRVRWVGSVTAAAALLAGGGAAAQAAYDPTVYSARFQAMYQNLHDSTNGYFSPDGVPYHAPETLLIEAPDYGHETTSEALSYWLWLEATQGRLTNDWSSLANAWAKIEQVAIPAQVDQPTNSFYKPSSPATYAPEEDDPSGYPAPLNSSVTAGQDPLADELSSAYGVKDVFGMHWILDVDNWYGYGNRADGTSKPSYINTFQRGPQESVWEAVPQPCWDAFKWGGKNGYLDLFVGDKSYAKQWKYSTAPDADARVVQAMYWASVWAQAQNKGASVPVAKASRIGDYLRYALFDKYFKAIGCQSTSCTPGTDRTSAHFLLSWYYAWGGATDPSSGWAWRMGSSHAHFGYQNPMAAYALSQVAALKPLSSKGVSDWSASLARQLEFYQWLQSAEGAIAGGATNSYKGRYEAFPQGTSTFYKMAYTEAPVYLDPPSNQWFGWQAWSMQRVAEYYLVTGNATAGSLLDRWVAWVKRSVQLPADGSYQIPSTLGWSGQPETWNPASPATNDNLHVSVVNTTNDVGVTASLARTLANYAAAKAQWAGGEDAEARAMAKELLDRMWTLYRDSKGVSTTEARDDYHRLFDQTVYIPSGWTGTMPDGDAIKPGVTFLDIRSKYKQDPDFARVQTAVNAGQVPQMSYHRFWAQVEVALANADFARLFPTASQPANVLPVVKITSPADGATFAAGASVAIAADASDSDGSVAKVEFFADGAKIGEDSSAPYTLQMSSVVQGYHVLVATATDDKGGKSSDQVVIAVGNVTPIGGADAGTSGDAGSSSGGADGGSGNADGGSGGADGGSGSADGGSGGADGGSGSADASSGSADASSGNADGGGASSDGGGSSGKDAGSSSGRDAGLSPGAGAVAGGCGCSSSSSPEAVAAFAAAVLALRARRRR